MAQDAAASARRIWQVGALCRAVADALEARFNPVAVRGEISGFSRASSGHCYFSLKDAQGQLRCAMFRRSAGLLDFTPRDGELVEAMGRLAVYEPRGDLQLIVESLVRGGQGALFEQFLRLKARLQAQGLFDPARKRPLPALPRGIGLVTSPGAAALQDVITALRRRAPHVPVVLAPAAVQGAQAPAELVDALTALYALAQAGQIDVILLVRGGGSMDDLWAFNDEQLARAIVRSPVPVVCGVGHETDFTIADFCADVRAPTPTAAAELAALPRDTWLAGLQLANNRLRAEVGRRLDTAGQRLDLAGSRLGRPSGLVARQQLRLSHQAQLLRHSVLSGLQDKRAQIRALQASFPSRIQHSLAGAHERLGRAQLQLELLDPKLVLQRGYAWVTDGQGRAMTRAQDLVLGQKLHLHLSQGLAGVTVSELYPEEPIFGSGRPHGKKGPP